GSGIIVAVLDTGIDASRSAFAGIEVVSRNFTDEADGDSQGPDTHTAATIVGRDVQGTRIGVAPGVTRHLVAKVLGSRGGSTVICIAIWPGVASLFGQDSATLSVTSSQLLTR